MDLRRWLLSHLLPKDREKLSELLEILVVRGVVTPEALRILRGVLRADERAVEEIMIPRADIVSVTESMPLSEVLNIYRKTPFSRFPVFDDRRDSVVGILYMKDLLKRIDQLDSFSIRDLMSPPHFIPEVKPVLDTLATFQEMHLSIAIVVDEFGNPVGLVTLEDLLEEVVGEIWEEHDQPETPWKEVAPGVYEVLATMNLEDFSEVVGLSLEDESVNTVGGYILQRVDHLPTPGEVLRLGNLEVEVMDASPQRLKRLRVRILKEGSRDEGAGA